MSKYRPPALSIMSLEALEQVYVKNKGSSKRRYNGLPYPCSLCKTDVSGLSPNEHYRIVHQNKVSIRFGDEKREYEIKRSRSNSLFECPRCDQLFEHPRHVQNHAAGWRGACPISSTSVDPPVKQSRSSTSALNTPQTRRTRRPRGETTPRTPQGRTPKSVARPLKTPTRTRTGIPNISRTFRAVIRQCYNQCTMNNKEIAEYCGCDVRDVYFAINNESGDNLDEDKAYLDGSLGDIVNIDNVDESMLQSAYHVEEKLDEDEDAMGETDAEEEVPQTNRNDPRLKAYPTPESDPAYDPSYDSEEEIERMLSAMDVDTPSDEEMHDEGAIYAGKSSHDVFMSEPAPLAPRHHAPLFQVPPPDPIRAFFSSLPKSTPEEVDKMTVVFKVYGVENADDLDMLSQMEGCWHEVESYVCGRGLTRGQWLRICDALRVRRTMVLGTR
ncbi:hypothetical protein PsYK624_055970 [Phanerochaete sordida]|uniref:Uncharacterized protein n=1 Tax=Phanerochaete sordida TaxID=48140 RepID=A0A9P3G726_9APHY|nr:hypothetical protein PsYK624_055970 [Phanerochaete sordida]